MYSLLLMQGDKLRIQAQRALIYSCNTPLATFLAANLKNICIKWLLRFGKPAITKGLPCEIERFA
jgi:hypothetical protein